MPRSTVTGVGVPGALGLNVTSCPLKSTAVHCETDGHATALSVSPLMIVAVVWLAGAFGLNVTSAPGLSTPVRSETDGHAIPDAPHPAPNVAAVGEHLPPTSNATDS